MTPNNPSNLILAIVLSVGVILLWQFFVLGPMTERQRAEQERLRQEMLAQEAADAPAAVDPATGALIAPPADGSAARPPVGEATPVAREAALAESGARLTIENARLGGSLRLTGARFDDIQLHGYRETIDPQSPEIVLLQPDGTTAPYFAEFGWLAPSGEATAVPGAETVWSANRRELTPDAPVVLTWDNGQGLVFTREIVLDENYLFTIHDSVQNRSGAPVRLFPYGLVQREGLPRSEQNWLIHEGMIGVLNGSLEEIDYGQLEGGRRPIEATGGWLGLTDKYWMSAVAPAQDAAVVAAFAERLQGPQPVFQADYIHRDPIEVPAGGEAHATHHLFAGAKIVSIIDSYAETPGLERFDLAVDWGWFFVITKPMFWALDQLFQLFGNFGVAIILFTVFIKAVFFPLANRSYEAMTKMKKVQPELMELREQYKNDPTELQKQMMELYRREKVNPLMGCLPVLIQIPVFFSLYKVLFVTIEMRHAPFFGWIQDLSAPDPTSLFNLFGLLPFEVPAYLQFGIWPILMGITMWAQMKLNPPPTDPIQQRLFAFMPWIFTVLLATFPAGLVIYWTVNNLLSILQQYVIMRRMGVEVDFFENVRLPGWAKAIISRRSGDEPGPPAA